MSHDLLILRHPQFTAALLLARRDCLSTERQERLAAADMQGVHRCEAEAHKLTHSILQKWTDQCLTF